jgi:hypothetical protein
VLGGLAEAAQSGNLYEGFEDLEIGGRIFFSGSAELASADSIFFALIGHRLISWTCQIWKTGNWTRSRLSKIMLATRLP